MASIIPSVSTPFTVPGPQGSQIVNPIWYRFLRDFRSEALVGTTEVGYITTDGSTFTGRSLVPASDKILITNGTGVSGNTTFDVDETQIDHDSLHNFVSNEHINHTSVTLTAGTGLTGGGDISTNRSFALAAGTVIQTVTTTSIAKSTSTIEMPFDETIPQISEGDEYFNLAITPISATSKLIIDIFIPTIDTDAAAYFTGALFQDVAANALQSSSVYIGTPTETKQFHLRYVMTAGTTSATTFRFRFGANSTNLAYCNRGSSAGTDDLFSTASVSIFSIQEIVV